MLAVLAPPSFSMRWLTPRLHRFAMTHPDIDVRASLDSPLRPESIDSHQLLHDDRRLMYEQQSYWELWLKAQNISKIDPGAGIRFSHSILALQAACRRFRHHRQFPGTRPRRSSHGSPRPTLPPRNSAAAQLLSRIERSRCRSRGGPVFFRHGQRRRRRRNARSMHVSVMYE